MPMRGRDSSKRPCCARGGAHLRPDRGQAEPGQDSPRTDEVGTGLAATCGGTLPRHVGLRRCTRTAWSPRGRNEGALALTSSPRHIEKEGRRARIGAAHEGKAIPEAHWSAMVAGVLEDGACRPPHRRAGRSRSGAEGVRRAGDAALVNGAENSGDVCPAVRGGPAGGRRRRDHARRRCPAGTDGGRLGVHFPALGMGPWRAHPDTAQLEPEDGAVPSRAAGSETGVVTAHHASAACPHSGSSWPRTSAC